MVYYFLFNCCPTIKTPHLVLNSFWIWVTFSKFHFRNFFTYHFLPLNETLKYDIANPTNESLNNFGFTLIHFVFYKIKTAFTQVRNRYLILPGVITCQTQVILRTLKPSKDLLLSILTHQQGHLFLCQLLPKKQSITSKSRHSWVPNLPPFWPSVMIRRLCLFVTSTSWKRIN